MTRQESAPPRSALKNRRDKENPLVRRLDRTKFDTRLTRKLREKRGQPQLGRRRGSYFKSGDQDGSDAKEGVAS